MIDKKKYRSRSLLSALVLFLTAVFLLPGSADAETANDYTDHTTIAAGYTPGESADASPIYGIGSVSKMFVTAAAMRLNDQELIDLDTPVITYIPEFRMADERYRLITVRMLLNHSSGLMGTTFANGFLYGNTDTDYHQVLLDRLKTQRLKADPGEYSVYCNDGFTLAEHIVERVSGLSFAQYIDQAFSIPLSLNQTFMPADIPDTSVTAPIYYRSFELPRQNILSLASGGRFTGRVVPYR